MPVDGSSVVPLALLSTIQKNTTRVEAQVLAFAGIAFRLIIRYVRDLIAVPLRRSQRMIIITRIGKITDVRVYASETRERIVGLLFRCTELDSAAPGHGSDAVSRVALPATIAPVCTKRILMSLVATGHDWRS